MGDDGWFKNERSRMEWSANFKEIILAVIKSISQLRTKTFDEFDSDCSA